MRVLFVTTEIFGLVARLVHQKGIDLVLAAADEIIGAGGQIIVTGSGEPDIEQRWSMRIAAVPTRSASPSASTTARRGGFSPAATSP